MTNAFNRRAFLLGSAAGVASIGLTAALPNLAQAQAAVSLDAARAHVDGLVAEVNRIIASGASESAMINDFAALFDRYADVPTIARYALGADARAATPQQLTAFTAAFRAYIARKYGRRFREFIGGEVRVVQARAIPNGVEVETTAVLRGQSPFRVDWHISNASGRVAFFNIIIEGVNMLLAERTEIQALLDQRRRDIGRLTADLPNL